MPQSLAITVSTRARRSLAWSVFADIESWHKLGGMYGAVHWKAGKPWAKGSHFLA